MPYGDGTGPLGYGPRSGRRAGFCGGYPVSGYLNDTVPRFGRGSRSFWGRSYHGSFFQYPSAIPQPSTIANLTKEEQKKILEEELEDLEAERKAIEKRMKELE